MLILGLPTQNIVNLLEDYGEDPYDRYPLHPQKEHSQPTLSALKERHTTRARYNDFPYLPFRCYDSVEC